MEPRLTTEDGQAVLESGEAGEWIRSDKVTNLTDWR